MFLNRMNALCILIVTILRLGNCAVDAYGYMFPVGDIIRNVNDSVEIICSIEKKDGNSSNLKFYFKDRDEKHYKPVEENVIVLNESAIALQIKHAQPMANVYLCSYDQYNIKSKEVTIGYPPSAIDTFSCLSYNWENMTCKFAKPDNNKVDSQYRLFYKTASSKEELSIIVPLNRCKLTPDNSRYYYCYLFFSGGTDGVYRANYPYYRFELSSNNSLGNYTQIFDIPHYEIVIPAPPERLNVTNITSDSMIFGWSMHRTLNTFSNKITFLITYKRSNSTDPWQKALILDGNSPTYTRQIKQFPYAYTWYDIRIKCKVTAAKETPEMWSSNATFPFQTAARIPDNPPETVDGCFHIDDNNNVYVYWKALNPLKLNGPNATYDINVVKGPSMQRKPNKNGTAMAKYDALAADPDIDLKFHVYSKNAMGLSREPSIVYIPSKGQRPDAPRNIKKILTHNASIRTYALSWIPPNHDKDITSYTIFWCSNIYELPNQCSGSIDFKIVDRNQTSYTHTGDETLNFAISSNVGNLSSGMVWVLCTALPDNDINKIEKPSIIPHATAVMVKWTTQCVDQAVLEGYTLEYCQITNIDLPECKDKLLSKNITNVSSVNYTLTGFMPYSTYKVRIAGYSANRLGPFSEDTEFTTLESKPSPPRNLTVLEVNSTGFRLQWEKPEHLNGVLDKYVIYYNRSSKSLNKADHKNNQTIEYYLGPLLSNTLYDIVVRAETIKRDQSDNSNLLNISTFIGKPSPIRDQSLNSKVLTWNPPELPGGNLDFYEFNISYSGTSKVVAVKQAKCTIAMPLCADNNIPGYSLAVRAVNIAYSVHANPESANCVLRRRRDIDQSLFGFNDGNVCLEQDSNIYQCMQMVDKHYDRFNGEWSSVNHYACSAYSGNGFYFSIIIGLFGLAALAIAVYIGMKKIKKMKDIGVIMPDGLKDIIEDTKRTNLNINCSFVSVDNHRTNNVYIGREQEQSLLKQNRMEMDSTNSNGSTNSQCEDNEAIDDSGSEHPNDDDSSAQTTTETVDTEKSCPIPILSLSVNTAELLKPRNVMPASIASPFIVGAATGVLSPVASLPQPFGLSSNNYVSPSMLSQRPGTTTNGYITHDALASRPVNTGYRPFSEIGTPKTADTSPDDAKVKIVASTDSQGISGYVTHKQLSDYGQSRTAI